MTRLVILVCGNPSRGDDALGPTLLRQLEIAYSPQKNITFVEDFQLQIEHALDLEHRDLALFIDASVSCSAPFHFSHLQPSKDYTYTTHALHPTRVLQVYQEIHAKPPPPAFLLAIRGESFQLGEPLSEQANQHLTRAFEFVQSLCENLDLNFWRNYLS